MELLHDWKTPQEGFVLVRDSVQASGSFLLAHHLRSTLHAGGSAVLVGLQATLPHYQQVMRKLGVSLATLRDQGRFAFVDLLTHPIVTAEQPDILQAAYHQIRHAVQSLTSTSSLPISLVIDSLSPLAALHYHPQQLVAFIHYCRMLVGGGAVVVVAHADVGDDEGWVAALRHVVGVDVEVQAVERVVGDVTGQMLVTYRSPSPTHAPDSLRQRFLYKVADAGIRFAKQPM